MLRAAHSHHTFQAVCDDGYDWVDVADFPSTVHHVHIEGGVVIDIFTEDVLQITEEVEQQIKL